MNQFLPNLETWTPGPTAYSQEPPANPNERDPLPLKPANTASPRDTLRTFLDEIDFALGEQQRSGLELKSERAYFAYARADTTLDFSTTPHHGSSSVRVERILALKEILNRLDGLLAASMNPSSPGWTGHMDPAPATASILGALAGAAINNNLLSYEMAPAFSRLEVALMAELARRFGLPEGAGGVMASGGSLANTLALAVARNRAFPEVAERGLSGLDRPPVLFASNAAHTSLAKAAMVLGLGRAAAVAVPCQEGRMVPQALAEAVSAARAAGQAPFAVVATAGTTVTGATDPLPPAPWRGETVFDRLQGVSVAQSSDWLAEDISDLEYGPEYDDVVEDEEELEHVAFTRSLDE